MNNTTHTTTIYLKLDGERRELALDSITEHVIIPELPGTTLSCEDCGEDMVGGPFRMGRAECSACGKRYAVRANQVVKFKNIPSDQMLANMLHHLKGTRAVA